jgi:serine/threonine-protein kinase
MSKFYMARDRRTLQVVGVKILDVRQTRALEVRLRGLKKPLEGEIAISLDHRHIVKTFEHGITPGGEQFLVMEFLDGPGLNSLIVSRSPLLDGNRLTLIRQAAEALAAVHKAGYIHRDVCPRNYVADREARSLKLIDFGLTVPATAEFMRPGNRTGTPSYMSPEVVRRRPTDQRLDIFSFGVTAYELCAHQLPWQGGTDGKAALSHDSEEPTPIETYRPTIDPRLAKAIMRCLAPNPDLRPQTMENFLQLIKPIEHEDVR